MYCTHCGTDNPEGVAFCSRCGKRLRPVEKRADTPRRASRPAERPTKAAPKKHSLFILVPITLLLVILVCLGILFTRGRSTEEPGTIIIEAVEDTNPQPEASPVSVEEPVPESEPEPNDG